MADTPLTYTGDGGETNQDFTHGTSDPWASGGILASNNFNSSEAIKADKRAFQMQQQSQAFNSSEAQKQRAYEERLSNTAVQRALADYKAAGFSPLALLGGNGASTPSGTSAHSSSASGHTASDSGALGGVIRGLGSLLASVVSSGISSAVKAGIIASSAASGFQDSSSRTSASKPERKFSDAEFDKLMDELYHGSSWRDSAK